MTQLIFCLLASGEETLLLLNSTINSTHFLIIGFWDKLGLSNNPFKTKHIASLLCLLFLSAKSNMLLKRLTKLCTASLAVLEGGLVTIFQR